MLLLAMLLIPRFFPLVFILVNGKPKNLYIRVIQELSDLILKQYKLTISIKFVITNLEKSKYKLYQNSF